MCKSHAHGGSKKRKAHDEIEPETKKQKSEVGKYYDKYPAHLHRQWMVEKNSGRRLEDIKPSRQIRGWWKCDNEECGHEWQTIVRSRRFKNNHCPKCARLEQIKTRKTKDDQPRENLPTRFPFVLLYWDFIKNKLPPESHQPTSGKQVGFACWCGYQWTAKILSFVNCATPCPRCRSDKPRSASVSFATAFPNLCKELHPTKSNVDPDKVTAYTSKRTWWQCLNNPQHEWEAMFSTRSICGCPYCAGKRFLREDSFGGLFPEIAKEWHSDNEKTPFDFAKSSNFRAKWLCQTCSHVYDTIISHRTKGHGCPGCSRNVPTDSNNLEQTHPHVAALWHPTKNGESKPSDYLSGCEEKKWWKCSKGHEWERSIEKSAAGSLCCACAKRIPSHTYNLKLCNPKLAAEFHPTLNEKQQKIIFLSQIPKFGGCAPIATMAIKKAFVFATRLVSIVVDVTRNRPVAWKNA